MIRHAVLVATLLLAAATGACDRDPPAESAADAATATSAGGPSGAAAQGGKGSAQWRVASGFSSTLPVLGPTVQRVATRLAALSGGRLTLQVFEPGKLVPPLEVFDAVGQGTVDAAFSVPASWFDRMPATAFFASPPFGADTVEHLAWLYEGRGLELWRELYAEHGVVPVPCGYVPPEGGGWFRDPLSGPEPFKGLKIHLYGLGGQVLTKLGAQVHVLSAEDLYPALERGVLDGAQVSVPSIDSGMQLGKVASHYYFPGWHQQASLVELLVHRARWDALSDVERTLVDTVCRDAVLAAMVGGEAQQIQALAALRKQGVTIHYWSDQQLQVFRNAYDAVLKEMRIKDEDFKRVHDAYQRFRQGYAEWAKLSRLPRGF